MQLTDYNRMERLRILKTFVFLVIFTSSYASASCDRESSNTYAINACQEEDFQAAESRLNDAYKRVLASLSVAKPDVTPDGTQAPFYDKPSEARKHLIAAQRAWIVFRENDCLASDNVSGFSTLRVAYFICMQRHAEIRTKQLLEYLENAYLKKK